MKKSTVVALYNYLNGAALTNVDEIREDLARELNRGQAAKDEKRLVYEAAHDIVFSALSADTPVTATELYNACADNLPDEFTFGKMVYALRTYWADEVVVTSDSKKRTNLYTKRV